MKSKLSLVNGYIENLRREALEDYLSEVKNYAKNKHGIYALYHKDKIYYVGLAKSLSTRLEHHLKDRHEGLWDSFSLYLTSDQRLLRELESLILRIFQPSGNRAKGKLKNSHDFKKDLVKELEEKQRAEREFIVGKRTSKKPRVRFENLRHDQTELVAYGLASMNLQGSYKGTRYKARVDRNGNVKFKNKIYPSLSAAGSAARGQPTNGWWFWKFKDKDGIWYRVDKKRS